MNDAVKPAVSDEWNRVDGQIGDVLLYTLRQNGWRKGQPVMVNDVTVRIERANGSTTDIDPIVARISAALVARGQEPVTVKPLEWDGQEARCAVGCYRVQALDDKWEPLHNGYYMLPRRAGVVEAFDTAEEARAFAQSDFETRIRSAITAPAQPVGVPEQPEGTVGEMTPNRAIYFLERFKLEEKMLGPHEKWALDYAIAMLSAAPQPPAEGEWEAKAINQGMAIAAGIVMRCWGEETIAREIMGAAGIKTLSDAEANGIEQYDIDALAPIFPPGPANGGDTHG